MTKYASDPAIYATLTRGQTFALTKSGKTFERGKPVPITAAERAYLEEHAVDRVAQPHEREEGDTDMPFEIVQKFTFRAGAAS